MARPECCPQLAVGPIALPLPMLGYHSQGRGTFHPVRTFPQAATRSLAYFLLIRIEQAGMNQSAAPQVLAMLCEGRARAGSHAATGFSDRVGSSLVGRIMRDGVQHRRCYRQSCQVDLLLTCPRAPTGTLSVRRVPGYFANRARQVRSVEVPAPISQARSIRFG